jgi:hypothetical protein
MLEDENRDAIIEHIQLRKSDFSRVKYEDEPNLNDLI